MLYKPQQNTMIMFSLTIKNLLLLNIILFSPLFINAQGWMNFYPEISSDPTENPQVFSGAQPTDDGGFFTWGTKGHSSAAQQSFDYITLDVVLTKTDLLGNVQWSQWYNDGEIPEMTGFTTFEATMVGDGTYLGIGNTYSGPANGSGDRGFRGVHFDAFGNILNSFEFDEVDTFGLEDGEWSAGSVTGSSPPSTTKLIEITKSPDGNFIILGSQYSPGFAAESDLNYSWLAKIDVNGNFLWNSIIPNLNGTAEATLMLQDLVVSDQGEIAVGGLPQNDSFVDNPLTGTILFRYDSNGNLLSNTSYYTTGLGIDAETPGPVYRVNLEYFDNGDLLAQSATKVSNWLASSVSRIGSTGDTLWSKVSYPIFLDDTRHIMDICIKTDGNIGVVYGDGGFSQLNVEEFQFATLDPLTGGTLIQGTALPAEHDNISDFGQGQRAFNLVPTTSNEMALVGQFGTPVSMSRLPYILKPDENGFASIGGVSGQVFWDDNGDCIIDPSELGMSDYLVFGGPFMSFTNTDGAYQMDLYPGEYNISTNFSLDYPYDLWTNTCPLANDVIITDAGEDIENINFGYDVLYECARLEVNAILGAMRPGFDNNIAVLAYKNVGTLDVEGVYIQAKIEAPLSIDSSSVAYTYDSGTGIYEFPVGDLSVFEEGGIFLSLAVPVDAELGRTVCLEAKILPFERCSDLISSEWDGSQLRVNANCLGDSIQYDIENIGEPMEMERSYAVYADNLLEGMGNVLLDNNEIMSFRKAATGETYRIEIEQAENFPEPSNPEATVEGCNGTEGPSTQGLINTTPRDDRATHIDVECTIITGAYDPNDKLVTPSGIGDNRYVNTDVQLDYTIRFQNTGNDTAFNVFVLDTLSEHFNITSFTSGPASHPHTVSLLPGNIVRWDFNNILLPDSTTNLIGSNGFLRFSIRFDSDIPQETEVHNTAAIYFDFNPPIITEDIFVTACDECLIQTLAADGVYFDGKVLLEGPYDGAGLMSPNLQSLIPNNQPYNISPYNYDGNEQLSAIPTSMVDWVLVEARVGTPAASGTRNTTTVETKAGILLSDGSIRGLDGISGIAFENLVIDESYHFCIRHRNHLDVLTATAFFPSENIFYDFTTGTAQALGTAQQKWMGADAKAVLYAGDFNGDGVIQTTDYDVWSTLPAAVGVYGSPDANLDGVIQVSDFDQWFFNKAKLGNIEIGF